MAAPPTASPPPSRTRTPTSASRPPGPSAPSSGIAEKSGSGVFCSFCTKYAKTEKVSRPLFLADLPEDEAVIERDLLEPIVAARGSAVAGGHVDLEDQRMRVGLERAHPRDVLG